MIPQYLDTVEKTTASVAVVAGTSSVVFNLTAQALAAIVGATVAVIALFINVAISIYFKRQHLKLMRERMTPSVASNMCSVCPLVKEAQKAES